MHDDTDLDGRLVAELRHLGDSSMATFDPDRVADRAMRSHSRVGWRSLIAAVATAAVVGVGAYLVATSVGQPETPVGDTSTSASPTASVTEGEPSQSFEPPHPSDAPPGGLTRSEAIELARKAAGIAPNARVVEARVLQYDEDAQVSWGGQEQPADGRWLWVVTLCTTVCESPGLEHYLVYLDYVDGRVYAQFLVLS
jgi:hypothetical protein